MPVTERLLVARPVPEKPVVIVFVEPPREFVIGVPSSPDEESVVSKPDVEDNSDESICWLI
jgi:hypothetical protein